MTSRDFCYWLQGFFEVGEPRELTAQQTDLVKRHLALVFKHEIDPSAGAPDHQAELNKIHHAIQEVGKEMEKVPPHSHAHHPDHTVYRC